MSAARRRDRDADADAAPPGSAEAAVERALARARLVEDGGAYAAIMASEARRSALAVEAATVIPPQP
ncbi:MAG: hypothetical protein WD993_09355, partial [Thermoleophilaceae bacterium]